MGNLFTDSLALSLRVYVVGGSGDSGDVEELLPPVITPPRPFQPAKWEAIASLITPRFGHAVSAATDGHGVARIYAIGGRSNPGGTLLNAVEGLSSSMTGHWSAMASMPTARERAAAATGQDGVIYVAGGSDASSTLTSSPLKNMEAYHVSTNTWKNRAHMHTARDGAAAVMGTDGRIYVIGGYGNAGSLSSVEAYDPATNSWTSMASMNTPRDGLAAVLGADGQIYAIGGENGAEALSTVEVYSFVTKKWTPGPSMSTARVNLAAATGPNALIYAIGGDTGFLGPTESVEVLSSV